VFKSARLASEQVPFKPVVKVGGIALLGAILRKEWANNRKMAVGGKTTYGGKTLNHCH